MKVKCIIELEHVDNYFDEELFAENLQDFVINDEQVYMDKGVIKVCTPKGTAYLNVGA